MTDNKKLLDILIKNTSNAKNIDELKNTQLSDEEVKKIKKKFKELELCRYILPKKLKIGMKVRYIDKDKIKCSITGVIFDIEYYSIIKRDEIKTIHLYNKTPPHENKYWKINPSEHYIFKYKTMYLTKNEKLINALSQDFLYEIEKYKKSLEDEDEI